MKRYWKNGELLVINFIACSNYFNEKFYLRVDYNAAINLFPGQRCVLLIMSRECMSNCCNFICALYNVIAHLSQFAAISVQVGAHELLHWQLMLRLYEAVEFNIWSLNHTFLFLFCRLNVAPCKNSHSE